MEDINHKIEDWQIQLEQAKEYDYLFDVNTVDEMIRALEWQQSRILSLEVERNQLFEERNMWIEASKSK